MDVSALEQELACNDNHSTQVQVFTQAHHTITLSSQLRELMVKIRGASTKAADTLRLALLYILRYQDQVTPLQNRVCAPLISIQADVQQLKRELIDGGVPQDKISLIDQMVKFAGKVRNSSRKIADSSTDVVSKGKANPRAVWTSHIHGSHGEEPHTRAGWSGERVHSACSPANEHSGGSRQE